MDVEKAISQISEIHGHLAKSEIFYGYRPLTVFFVGITAFVVAAVQTWLITPKDDMSFIIQWLFAGSIIIVIIGGNILHNYLNNGNNFEIQQMSKVFLQFVPSILAGFIISLTFIIREHQAIVFLPGIFAILFGLGIFSMRPYLPKMVGWVAMFYLFAGAVLLCLVDKGLSMTPWGMGITFGIGHMFAALVLKLDVQRQGI